MSKGIAPVILLAVSAMIFVFWTILILIPSGWQVKSTLILDFNVGLYNVKVSKAIVGNLLTTVTSAVGADSVTKFIDTLSNGETTIQAMRDNFCNLGMIIPSNCTPWNNLLYGSWIMLLTAVITCILLFTGGAMYYHYYKNESLRQWRQWSIGLFSAAPIVAIGGLGSYACLTFSFSNWLSELAIANQSTLTFGVVSFFAVFVGLLTVLPIILVTFCGTQKEAEFFEEQRQLDYGMDPNYGAAQPGYDGGYQDPYGNQGQGYPAQQPYAQYPQ